MQCMTWNQGSNFAQFLHPHHFFSSSLLHFFSSTPPLASNIQKVTHHLPEEVEEAWDDNKYMTYNPEEEDHEEEGVHNQRQEGDLPRAPVAVRPWTGRSDRALHSAWRSDRVCQAVRPPTTDPADSTALLRYNSRSWVTVSLNTWLLLHRNHKLQDISEHLNFMVQIDDPWSLDDEY